MHFNVVVILSDKCFENLWLNSFNEKSEKFEILFDLEILDNKVDKDEKEIIFKRTNQANQFVNFRDGDICVFRFNV